MNDNKIKEFTISAKELNKKVFCFIIPFILLLSWPYFILWYDQIWQNLELILISNFLITLLVLLTGMLVHELIHGLTWALFCKSGFKSVTFGFSKNNLAPYCHCRKPIRLKYYILGGLVPAILMGLIPSVISWFTGNPGMFLFGLVFTFAAGSDILICLKLINQDMNDMAQDFPDKPGCSIFKEE